MSLPAILWAMYEVPKSVATTPTEKLVLMVLAEHADPDGDGAFPSWQRIGDIVEVSRRTVASVLASLESKGLIVRGDQATAVAKLARAGKDVRYAPTVWDLNMTGSHAAAVSKHLPGLGDEDREASAARAQVVNKPQVIRGAEFAPVKSAPKSSIVDNCVCAGDQGCRICTPGLSDGLRGAEIGVLGVQLFAPKPSTSTKSLKTPPPAIRQAPAADGLGVPLVVDGATRKKDQRHHQDGAAVSATNTAGSARSQDVQVLVQAVLDGLPDSYQREVSTPALRRVCQPLVGAGWTAVMLTDLVKNRSWVGAINPGGVLVSWLRDLASEAPPQPSKPSSRWPAWCGQCDGAAPAMRTIIAGDRVLACPDCNPKSAGYDQAKATG